MTILNHLPSPLFSSILVFIGGQVCEVIIGNLGEHERHETLSSGFLCLLLDI